MRQLFYLLPALVILAVATLGQGAESGSIQECLKETDPMGSEYRGTMSQTENGLECQRWDTDEPHTRHEKPGNLDNNYCRNPYPDESCSRLPWCYTNVPGDPRWEYCSIETCSSSCSGLSYDNKCFIAVDKWVHQDVAAVECNILGGSLANIYSQSHMDAVMSYIRENVQFNDETYFHLGMTFDPQANRLYLRDGTDAPDGLKWENSPGPDKFMALEVHTNPYDTSQYLFNSWSSLLSRPLCEIE